MSGLINSASRHELAAALGWLVDAGADTIVGDQPYDWLASTQAIIVAPRTEPVVAATPARAEVSAINADSLASLAAALAEFHGEPVPLFGEGVAASGVMMVGDRPTNADAVAGRVFGDAAGALLDRMLTSIGRSRETAYLANLIAWTLPSDRTPNAAEIAATAPFLRRQIVLARPRAILALGQAAAGALCGSTLGINRLRGRWHDVDIDGISVAVMPTFHPAHLLLQPAHKALAWTDLCAFRARIDA